MSLLPNSLAALDPEDSDGSLSHESGLCASTFGSGLIVFENVETEEALKRGASSLKTNLTSFSRASIAGELSTRLA